MPRVLIFFGVRMTRIDLSRLYDQQLCDNGLTREDTENKLARPLRDVPPHWRHS